jgi:hypothetical protein
VAVEVEAGTTTTQDQVDREAANPTLLVPQRAVEPLAKDFLVEIMQVTMQPEEVVALPDLVGMEMHQLTEQVMAEPDTPPAR